MPIPGSQLMVNASNIGEYDISDFQIVKATAFRLDCTPVYTFGMTASDNMTIVSGANELLTYEEDRYVPRGTYHWVCAFLECLSPSISTLKRLLLHPSLLVRFGLSNQQ